MRYLILLCLLWPMLAQASDINPGDTEALVEAVLGKPESVMDAGSKKILIYEKTKVTLKNGVVTKVEAVKHHEPASPSTAAPVAKAQGTGMSAVAQAEAHSVAALTVEEPTKRSLYVGEGYTAVIEAPKNFAPIRNAVGVRKFPMTYQTKGFDEQFILTVASVSDQGSEDLTASQVAAFAIQSGQSAYTEFSEAFNQMRMVGSDRGAFYGYEGIPKAGPSKLMRFEAILVKVEGGFIIVSVLGPKAEFKSIQYALDAMLLSLKVEES